MAIPSLTPYAATRDLLSLQDCSRLLKRTGHPASVSTLRRWIDEDGVIRERHGRKIYVSFSDILVVHRDRVLARD